MRYWVYLNGEVPGSYEPAALAALPGFSQTSLVCPAEGEILEKNWKRAGEIPELILAMGGDRSPQTPAKAAPEPSSSGDANQVLDAAGARLLSHVAHLTKEFEVRREERALLASLQTHLIEIKEELDKERRARVEFEGRAVRVPQLEESVSRGAERIKTLEESVKGREEGLAELRAQFSKLKEDFERASHKLDAATQDLAIRNRLVDKLSKDLTEKEFSLTKALGLVRALESNLNRLAPEPVLAPPRASAPSAPPPAPPPKELIAALPPEPEPSLPPAAQGALMEFFKKFVSPSRH